MAGSVGLLPGVGIGPVFAQALPGPMSALMAQTAVVILSFMILVGRGIRPAALSVVDRAFLVELPADAKPWGGP